jgi:hypothetical protein
MLVFLQIRQDLFVVYFTTLSVSRLYSDGRNNELEGTLEGSGRGLIEVLS